MLRARLSRLLLYEISFHRYPILRLVDVPIVGILNMSTLRNNIMFPNIKKTGFSGIMRLMVENFGTQLIAHSDIFVNNYNC